MSHCAQSASMWPILIVALFLGAIVGSFGTMEDTCKEVPLMLHSLNPIMVCEIHTDQL
jgi:hypothetical protein